MFHIQDGWQVERRPDGSVLLETRSPVRRAIIIDPSSWASVVATVSAKGETSETYRAALEAHMSSAP